MKTVAELRERLQALHARTAETPLFNPVFQVSLDLSREIESGTLNLGGIEQLVAEMECQALKHRAAHLRRLLAPVAIDDNLARFRALLDGEGSDFGTFRQRWERPALHAVFTAHPTFLLSPAQADAVAATAATAAEIDDRACVLGDNAPAITLHFEHDEAIAAIARAAEARDRLTGELLAHARRRWPERWLELSPQPFRFATWVGYDMDGRTDIAWSTSVSFRLLEKASRLAGYAEQLRAIAIDHPLVATLQNAAFEARARAEGFAGKLDDPAALSAAANRLTADHPDKLVTLAPVLEQLEHEAQRAGEDEALALKVLTAAMRADGLGVGWIHFRVNASQLHNAIRRRMDAEGIVDIGSKGALARLRELLAEARPLRTNFAALAVENATAIRQFLAMAQILGHIDADAPIRMLIAECEQPQTVLAALYFARLFGIEDKVDVSPLFETETALEHGGRFLEALFAEESYRSYVRQRGRVAIQTGFSDAGRFVGQVSAALAIERLQGRLAQSMAANGLTDVAALIFNTHGESMGRGAHPASFADRLTWPLSPWARRRFAKAGIALEAEASFQGGDGYLFFRAPELALATLVRIAEHATAPLPEEPDPFYSRTDLSLDFYRGIRGIQRRHLESRTYARAVTAFGLGLIKTTGSRVSRRQSGLGGDRAISLRQIRAIPHNAILQQLGYPVNVITGAGTAGGRGELEAVADLLTTSPRGRQLVRLLRAANGLASIKTVAAFGELFNSAYWASRPYRGTETMLEHGCLALAEYLTGDDRTGVFRRLASRLRVDWMQLHRLLALVPQEDKDDGREEARRSIGLLQALRLALLQHMFLRAAQVPAFSRSNDISREDVLEMVLSLRIDEAVAQLRRAFPVAEPKLDDFAVDEPSDYPDYAGEGYVAVHQRFVDPIERAHALNLRIATAIANHFGAHG